MRLVHLSDLHIGKRVHEFSMLEDQEFILQQILAGIPVLMISGNHDSPERLAFGAQLMSRRGVHFAPVYDGKVQKLCLRDCYGEAYIWLLPFLKPAVVRHALGEEAESYQEALELAVAHMAVEPGERNLLVAHQFVTGAAQCDSEAPPVRGQGVCALLRHALEVFLFRGRAGEIRDHRGTEGKRECGDPHHPPNAPPGYAENKGDLYGGNGTFLL